MAMTRLSDPMPRMTLPRALLSEALRLARSPLAVVHLVCGLAAGLACGEYFSIARWDPALGADAYACLLYTSLLKTKTTTNTQGVQAFTAKKGRVITTVSTAEDVYKRQLVVLLEL